MRLHSGEKPFSCKLCPAKFTQVIFHEMFPPITSLVVDFFFVLAFFYVLTDRLSGFSLYDYIAISICLYMSYIRKRYICLSACRSVLTTASLCAVLPFRSFVYQLSLWEKEYEKKIDFRFSFYYQFVHLKLHKRLHANERPYECPQCKKKYISASGLKTHWKSPGGCTPPPGWLTEKERMTEKSTTCGGRRGPLWIKTPWIC